MYDRDWFIEKAKVTVKYLGRVKGSVSEVFKDSSWQHLAEIDNCTKLYLMLGPFFYGLPSACQNWQMDCQPVNHARGV